MSTEVLIFHPDLAASTTNKALAEALRDLPGVHVRDLYATYPDWQIDVPAEQKILEGADRIVLQYPVYWYSVPPLLKKYLDDVFTYGWAYGSAGHALEGKELQVAVTAGATINDYTRGNYGFTLTEELAPMHTTANYVGMSWAKPFMVHSAGSLPAEELAAKAARYRELLSA